MTPTDWFILIMLAITVAYELYAAITNRVPTISEGIWKATKRMPWIKWVGTAIFVILILHFWFGLWAPQ